MSDFQCPWCRKQALEVLPLLERGVHRDREGALDLRELPDHPDLHPNAGAAAEFAMCAAKAGSVLADPRPPLPVPVQVGPAQGSGAVPASPWPTRSAPRETRLCPVSRNRKPGRSSRARPIGAARSGVASTPTVYIEGAGLLKGAAPLETYRQILDSLWKERTAQKSIVNSQIVRES